MEKARYKFLIIINIMFIEGLNKLFQENLSKFLTAR